MSSVMLVTGPPGAGKSTVAAELVRQADRSVLVEGDAFFAALGDSLIDPWLPEADVQNRVVMDAAGAAVGALIRSGHEVVFDGIVGPWFLPRFLRAAQVEALNYVVLLPSLHICLARVSHRTSQSFDDEAATMRMHRDFAESSIEKRHLLVDENAQPEELAREILSRRRLGELRWSMSTRDRP